MCIRKNAIKLSAAIASILLMLSSCQSTKEEISSDSYNPITTIETEEETQDEEVSEIKENEEPGSKTFTSNESKAKKTWSQNLLTLGNKDDFIMMEETSKIITKDFSGLVENDANFLLRANTNLAGFGCSIMGAYFIPQFDENARARIASAAQQYFDDFENKKLSNKKNIGKNAYGSIDYKINWGTFKSSTPNNGTGTGYLGYEFVKNQPYFIIWNYPFKNDYYEASNETTTRESAPVKFYFTRNQLKKLVDTLSEENLANYYYSF